MRSWKWIAVWLFISLLALGCGSSSRIQAKGSILKGGQPYRTSEGEGLRIVFAPLDPPAGTQYDSFAAAYDPSDGSFQVLGKDREGLPPGKYRISLQLMSKKEDLWGGQLVGNKSPFTCEVTPATDHIVIDLDQAHLDSSAAGARMKKNPKR
jgi:hypothetical protein